MKDFSTSIKATLFVLLQSVILGDVLAQTSNPVPAGPAPSVAESTPGNPPRREYLPGEEVVTQSGKRMKVWSTEGPVPSSQPPQPPQAPAVTVVPMPAEPYQPDWRDGGYRRDDRWDEEYRAHQRHRRPDYP